MLCQDLLFASFKTKRDIWGKPIETMHHIYSFQCDKPKICIK